MAPIRLTRNRTRKQQTTTSNNENFNAANIPLNNPLQQFRMLLHNGGVPLTNSLPLPPTYQHDQMGKNHTPSLPGLHHSSDNYEPTTNTVLLRYPFSGATERFSFSKRMHKYTHRHHARPLHPIEDLILTVQSFHIQAGTLTSAELSIMRDMLMQTYEENCVRNSNPIPLQRLLDNFTNSALFLPIQPPTQRNFPLAEDMTTHLLTQLHDRTTSDSAALLSRPSSSSFSTFSSITNNNNNKTHPTHPLESTYGELLPPFLHKIYRQTHLTNSSTYIDLGAGVGQTCFLAALATGCRRAWGIEREARCWALGCAGLEEFRWRRRLWGLLKEEEEEGEEEEVVLRKGDFLKAEFVKKWLREADVVLVNNLKLEPETDLELAGILGDEEMGVKRGTRVVSLKMLVLGGRRGGRKGVEVIGKRNRDAGQEEKEEDEVRAKKRKEDVGNARGRERKMLLTLPPEGGQKKLGVAVADTEVGGQREILVERSGEDDVWKWKQYVYEAGSVSWSNKPGLYYISTRK
ncbi:hypothetical protein CERZMDRAFT_101807 [Cercospora zeae-maydis SCOH1-5]|uniref:Histone-lysine N-methyltransferase, H3 lysine-79 specific n=1 Tax=Cercospora zeae-maydis SCOH1-5 TaxID=717836 RepID=A0A6A6F493_9PEZI|nr:hypothetical protein CERZMDRAFT_101807 [Cercospora zeae-maydis SCOH1-5]